MIVKQCLVIIKKNRRQTDMPRTFLNLLGKHIVTL
jgi:hypothetical protein